MILLRGMLFSALLAAISCGSLSADAARPRRVDVTADKDTEARVYLYSGSPVVFEVGKLGLPWRRVTEAQAQNHIVRWPAKRGRSYQAWDAEEFAREQLRIVRASLGHQSAGSTPIPSPAPTLDAVTTALRWVQKQRASGDTPQLQQAEVRLSHALSALLDVRIRVDAGVGLKVWPEYTLPLTASLECRSKEVLAKFASFTMPDNWKMLGGSAPSRARSAASKPVRTQVQVRVPARSTFYPGDYPLVAWFDVEYAGTRFKASNAVEAKVTHPFERDGWIDTVSETEVDLHVRLKSLLPIKGITTELSLPDGWTGKTPCESFDLNGSRVLTYRITRPAEEPRGLRIVGGLFRLGDYTISKRLLTDHLLSLSDTTAVAGFRLLQVKGDESPAVTVSDRECRATPPSGKMHFDASENFPPGKLTYVTVGCATTDSGEVSVDYRDASGKLRSTAPQAVDVSGGWQHRTFTIENAVFDGSLPNGADFTIRYNGKSLGVAWVGISRFRAS